jgi:hypothetical protein
MLGTISVYNLYYGDFSGAVGNNTMYLVDYFSANLGGTPWYNIMTSYYQISTVAPRAKIYMGNNLIFKKRYLVNPAGRGTTTTTVLNQRTFINALIAQFNNPNNPLPVDPNAVYMFIVRGDFTMTANGGAWLTDWCAYHSAFYLTNGWAIKYTVAGDPSTALYNGGNCEWFISSTVNGNVGADSIVSYYAHELVETSSDFEGAWFFDSGPLAGSECADACAWTYGNIYNANWNMMAGNKKFLVQQNFQPGVGCTMALQSY